MDGHQCLHYDLRHADHIKRLIQTLRLKRICSEENVHFIDLRIS